MVYFVGSKIERKVKIGSSGLHIKQRFRTIQANCPFDIEVFLFINGMRTVEKYLHNKFKTSHLRGEWFILSPDIQAFINNPILPHIEETDKPLKRVSDEDKKMVEQLYSQGLSVHKIASQLSYSYGQIRNQLTREKLYDKYKAIRAKSGNKSGRQRGNKKYLFPDTTNPLIDTSAPPVEKSSKYTLLKQLYNLGVPGKILRIQTGLTKNEIRDFIGKNGQSL